MHLYLIARGAKDRLDRWVNDCLAQYFTFVYGKSKVKDIKNGKEYDLNHNGMMQLSMRPVQLYEVVFPETHLNHVLSLLQPYGGFGFKEGVKAKLLKIFTKILKLEPMPVVPPNQHPGNFLIRDGVDVLGLGIKRDKFCDVKKREDI